VALHVVGSERLGDDEAHAETRGLLRVESVAPAGDEPERDVRKAPLARGRDVPAERKTILLVYLISSAGDASENARSNDARSSGEMSETTM